MNSQNWLLKGMMITACSGIYAAAILMIAACFGGCSGIYAASLPLVKGKTLGLFGTPSSAYSIYVADQAPATVKLAAGEIQRVISVATGVKLPIVNQPVAPMICLGDNHAARTAGLSAEALPDDSFQILAKNQNLYIVGKDTPDNFKWRGWESRGTLYGAYDFLEKAVGARWLMPGDVGEEIPTLASLTVSDMDRKESPAFSSREMRDIQNGIRPPNPNDHGPAQVDRWLLRRKCANIFDRPPNRFDETQACREKILYNHAWRNYIKPEDMQAHPEFQAEGGSKGKFCTSNPEAVALFAQRVMEWLEQHPDRRSAPISPEDGGDFCKCAKCAALTAKDWHDKVSYTPVILKFYNDVAKIVGRKYPDRILGGIVYYNYMYPPAAPVKMEPNMYLVLAALPYYGWGLAKPLYREEFPELISAWTSITTNFGYCSYTVWLRAYNGTPLPPALPLLKQEIPTLHKHGVQSVAVFGIGAWGYGAIENYILTKLLWDSQADVDALFQEWLQKAYGPAWQAMKQFYMLIEDRVLERKRKESAKYGGDSYEVNLDFVDKVYKPVFPEMERLYSLTLSQVKTEKQRRRLEMLGENMIMLHYNMRKENMLKDPEKSIFFRTDEAYKQFLNDTVFSLALYRNAGHRDVPPLWHGSFRGEGENPPMETRKVTIPRLPRDAPPPVIDGDLSDPVWQSAGVADQFREVGKRKAVKQQTTARLLYDNATLYIAFTCSANQPGRIQKKASARDSADVFSDDCVEIMLATFPNARQQFWHLALTAGNVQWDGIVGDAEKQPAWKSAARITENGWAAEIAIPFQSLDMQEAPAGKSWSANLAREEKANNENSAWNAVYRAFMESYSFGEWTFAP